ncbi:glycosyl transferase family 2 [Methanobacterium sp. SMA-27]|uniref:glycosyl transferase family 2 n=1 Tax=Methanobacterium sp. SMA-27 TaxID=1495336 RepID=UPI0012E08897|nr:glycosyl transferase family 2 [Methanobacterium sp. SMA-27]
MDELEYTKFPLDELFSLEVNNNNVKYEFIIRFSSINKNLICFGSGAYEPEKISPPIYRRHSWESKFEESVIYYNDPTLYIDPELYIGWGIGKIDDWYLLVIADIIQILARKNNITPENMLFFGSSGGGFTAIMLSTFIKNSSVIVNNPQIFLTNYAKRHLNQMINSCFDNLDLETVLEQYGHRIDIVKCFEHQQYMPNLTYIVNSDSKNDILNHFIPFIESLVLFKYFNERVKILLYKNEKGHDGQLDPNETIKLIKNHFIEKNDISNKKQLNIAEKDPKHINKQLQNNTNKKPNKITYMLQRFSHEFLKRK